MQQNIGNMLELETNNQTYFNRDITLKNPADDSSVPVVRFACTLTARDSFSLYMKIENKQLYENNKEIIQQQVNIYLTELKAKCQEYNIPLISL